MCYHSIWPIKSFEHFSQGAALINLEILSIKIWFKWSEKFLGKYKNFKNIRQGFFVFSKFFPPKMFSKPYLCQKNKANLVEILWNHCREVLVYCHLVEATHTKDTPCLRDSRFNLPLDLTIPPNKRNKYTATWWRPHTLKSLSTP